MKQKRSKAESIDEYIAEFPAATREALREIRALIQSAVPEAREKISYAIPTFLLNGNLVHFAGYERHIRFYPGSGAIEAFKKELTSYKSAKGSVQFPLGQPLPKNLIRRMVEFSVAERRAKLKKGGKKKTRPRGTRKAKRK